jgi:hypothetical protein
MILGFQRDYNNIRDYHSSGGTYHSCTQYVCWCDSLCLSVSLSYSLCVCVCVEVLCVCGAAPTMLTAVRSGSAWSNDSTYSVPLENTKFQYDSVLISGDNGTSMTARYTALVMYC